MGKCLLSCEADSSNIIWLPVKQGFKSLLTMLKSTSGKAPKNLTITAASPKQKFIKIQGN
jgi:hypothetical protein